MSGIFDTGIFDTGIFDHQPVVTGTLAATDAPDTCVAFGSVVRPGRVVEPDVGAEKEKRRVKKRDKDLERYKLEKDELRKQIEKAINPLTDKSEQVIVSENANGVEILTTDGQDINITAPVSFPVAEVAQMVQDALQAAQMEVQRVKRREDALRMLAEAKAQLARIIKRRRDDELLLLMD